MYILNKLLTLKEKEKRKASMHSSMKHILKSARQPLNIIEEFAALSPQRKVLLCDHLFSDGFDTFENTVKLLWPEAKEQDIKKLEKFLILLKKTAH